MQHPYGQYNQPQNMYQPPVLPHFRDRLIHPILQYNGELFVHINDYSHCFYCHASIAPVQGVVCSNCGFPQGLSLEEQRQFLSHKRILFVQRQSVIENRLMARNMLFIAAGIYLLMGLLGIVFGYGSEDDIDTPAKFIELLITVGCFTGLGILAHQYTWWGVVLSVAVLSLHMMFLYLFYGLWLFLNVWILLKLFATLGVVIYAFYLVNESTDTMRKLSRFQVYMPGE